MAKSSSSITGQVHEKLSHTCIHGHFHSLEDEQIIWTDKSFQTNKSSYAQTGQTNFSTKILSKSCLTFGRLERRFSTTICLLRWTSRREYDIKLHQTNKCWTICIHVQTIDLSSSVRMANLLSHKENYSIASECKASISWSFSGKARCALVQVSVYYPRATPTQSVHLQATLICLVQHFTTNLKYPLQDVEVVCLYCSSALYWSFLFSL